MILKKRDPGIMGEIKIGIPFLGFDNLLKVSRFYSSLPCEILEPENDRVMLKDMLLETTPDQTGDQTEKILESVRKNLLIFAKIST